MPNAVDKRAFRKRLSFKPSQRSRWSRSGRRWSRKFRREWCCPMRAMERARNSALTSPNSDCNMRWASSRQHHSLGTGAATLAGPAAKTRPWSDPKRLQRSADHQPISVKQLALGLPSQPGSKSVGVRAVKELYAPVSLPFVCVLHIAITSARNHIRKNGF